MGPLARLGAAKFVAVGLLLGAGLIGWTAMERVFREPVRAAGATRADNKDLGWMTGDFGAFYVAGEAAASGRPALAYDRARTAARMDALGFRGLEAPAWSYPPPALFLVRPLPEFDGLRARAAWTALMLLAAAAAAALAARDARAAALALPFPGLQLALVQGQVSGLVALALAPAIGFADRRPFLAGLALGGLVFKPHLLVGPGLVMLGAGRWRVAAGAAVGGTALALAALLVFGWAPWPAFAAELLRRAGDVAGATAGFQPDRMVGAYGLAARLLGPGGVAFAVHAACALAALAMAIRVWRLDAGPAARALALVVAALAVPTLAFEYDLVLLILPLAAWLGAGLRAGARPGWGAIALAALALAFGALAYACWHVLGVQPASLVLLAALALAWRRAERSRP